MADASDSKSDVGDYVWVQVPSPAFEKGFYTRRYRTLFSKQSRYRGTNRVNFWLRVDSAKVQFLQDMLRRQFRRRLHSGYQLENALRCEKPL